MTTRKTSLSPYWACQVVGWALYAIGVVLPYVSKPPIERMLAYALGLALAGLAQTHALRGFVKRRGWECLEVRRLAPRVLATSAVMGVGMIVFMTLADVYWFRHVTWEDTRTKWPFLALAWIWWYFPVFVGWQAVYFAVQFVRRVRTVETEKWQLKTEAQAAELQFLKAQLNPHFLFNALNGVRGLISEDPERAQTMVTHLSSFLRQSLNPAAATVPLSRELEVVGEYLAIEAIRLEERLSVTMDIEPAALCSPVPAMLVQALVENGIKHGIALLPRGGELAVRARIAGGSLEVVVTNTAAPRPPAEGKGSESGIGLRNARERLRLLFGEEASLALAVDEGESGLTTARVRIPGAA